MSTIKKNKAAAAAKEDTNKKMQETKQRLSFLLRTQQVHLTFEVAYLLKYSQEIHTQKASERTLSDL